MTHFISLITISLNSEKTIARTIESIISQTRLPNEYIFIDGKSDDKTLEIISTYTDILISKGVSVKIISEKDNGLYDAMNKGISYCSNGYIIGIVNSDDSLLPNALELVEKSVSYNTKDNPEDRVPDIVYGDVIWIGQKKNKLIKASLKNITKHMSLPHLGVFVNKHVYDQIGVFDPSAGVCADYDFILRSFIAGYQFKNIGAIVGNFYSGGASGKYWLFLENAKILRKNNIISYPIGYLFNLATSIMRIIFSRIHTLMIKKSY